MTDRRTAAERRMADQVARATKRVAQLQARQLFRELCDAEREKEAARRSGTRRRLDIGSLVESLVPDWAITEVAGALLDGRSRATRSPTVRVAYRRHGERHLVEARGRKYVLPSDESLAPTDRQRSGAEAGDEADATDERSAAALATAMGLHENEPDTG